jgi:3-oxoacyl-[acyl-carrier-protein] synthase II
VRLPLETIFFTFAQRIAGEIKSFSTDGWVAPKLSKRMDKFMLYMLTAGKKALADGGITEDVMDELNKTKCGVLIGSAMGGMKVDLISSQFKIFCL